jgi:hypothetical protein
MKDRDVRYTFWDYLKKGRWGCLRRKLRVRAIVLYWLKLTESLIETGNAAFARDNAQWDAMWEKALEVLLNPGSGSLLKTEFHAHSFYKILAPPRSGLRMRTRRGGARNYVEKN